MSLEDKAQELEQAQWELRNVNRRHAPPPAQPDDADYGPEECDECGDPMPALRRADRRRLCTECASAAERLLRR